MFYPIRETVRNLDPNIGRFFVYFVPLATIGAFAAVYEIMEWYTVSGLSSAVGYLFIGGSDPFDSQKDMLLALIGAGVALASTLAVYFIRARLRQKNRVLVTIRN